MFSWIRDNLILLFVIGGAVFFGPGIFRWMTRRSDKRLDRHESGFCNKCGWKGKLASAKRVCGRCGSNKLTLRTS